MRAGRRAGPVALAIALLAGGTAAGPVAGVVGRVPPRPQPVASLPQPPGVTTLVSQRVGGGFPSGGSGQPSTSSNGRYVAFASGSAELVTGDVNDAVDVFVRDRSKNTTIRLPLPGGAPVPPGGQAMEPSISADGNVVAFTYTPPIGFGAVATSTTPVVLAWDRKTGKTALVSLRSKGVGAGNSSQPSVSADGRYVAFTSLAPIGGKDSNELPDVFRYDRTTGKTVRVSQDLTGLSAAFGTSASPSISSDGSLVAFTSDAGDSIVPENTGPGTQVYVRNLTTGLTERISKPDDGGAANSGADAPSISADGRYVAFETAADNLVPNTEGAGLQVYRWDRTAGHVEMVSVDVAGAPLEGQSGQAAISRDGRMVAFISSAPLVIGSTGIHLAAMAVKSAEVYIRDMTAAETALVSVTTAGGRAGVRSLDPSVAGNGRFVAFWSNGATLVKGDDNNQVDVFMRDMPPVPILNPPLIEFGNRAVGTDPVSAAGVLANAGWGPLSATGATVTGSASADFTVQADTCAKIVLHRGEACTVTVGFSPTKPGARTATLEIADNYTGTPRTARLNGSGSLAELKLDPPIGRPGIVTVVTGSGFPPGAQLTLRWSMGITPTLGVITADAQGAFRLQVLVFHNDRIGKRDLEAQWVAGEPFPPVSAEMLITASTATPPSFAVLRRLLDLPLVLVIRG